MLRRTILPCSPRPESRFSQALVSNQLHICHVSRQVSGAASSITCVPLKPHRSGYAASSRPPARFASTGGGYASYADSLARRPAPTLLYRSPPMRSFTVGTYIVGTVSAVWGAHHGDLFLFHTQGISPMVKTAYAGLCLFMFTVALWQFSRVRRSVHASK